MILKPKSPILHNFSLKVCDYKNNQQLEEKNPTVYKKLFWMKA